MDPDYQANFLPTPAECDFAIFRVVFPIIDLLCVAERTTPANPSFVMTCPLSICEHRVGNRVRVITTDWNYGQNLLASQVTNCRLVTNFQVGLQVEQHSLHRHSTIIFSVWCMNMGYITASRNLSSRNSSLLHGHGILVFLSTQPHSFLTTQPMTS